jgi:hypothetical protein
VMKLKLSTISSPPPSLALESAKFDAAVRERERSNRVLFEFGSEAVPATEGASAQVA